MGSSLKWTQFLFTFGLSAIFQSSQQWTEKWRLLTIKMRSLSDLGLISDQIWDQSTQVVVIDSIGATVVALVEPLIALGSDCDKYRLSGRTFGLWSVNNNDLQRHGSGPAIQRRSKSYWVDSEVDNLLVILICQLSSLYEVRPPISKAKMSQITRVSMKAIKMYKHIVQSVERFIIKVSQEIQSNQCSTNWQRFQCRPEYKIPGLYVIDSIVRQSRHQFGADKDVYAARFARNFAQTFQSLFLTCPPDDKVLMERRPQLSIPKLTTISCFSQK